MKLVHSEWKPGRVKRCVTQLSVMAARPAAAELVCLQKCDSVSAVDKQQQDRAATSLNSARVSRLRALGPLCC